MYRTESNLSAKANLHSSALHAAPAPAVETPRYRARDFGIGYGRSSGYAAARSYAPASAPAPRFRVV